MASPTKVAASNSPLLSWIIEHEPPFQSPNRLASLYSDFSASRASNPDGYAANISAWRTALAHACRAGVASSIDPSNNTFVVRTGPTLATALERRDAGRPSAGIQAVQEDSIEQKHWYRRDDFLQRKQSVYWKPWLGVAVPAAEDVFVYLMKRAGLASDTRLTRQGEFVILSNVEDASEQVLKQRAAQDTGGAASAAVYSLETFVDEFAGVLDEGDGRRLSMPEMSILLAHLYRDRKAIDMSHSDKTGATTIKFAQVPGTPDPIEESDATIAHVKTLLRGLTRQITSLQARATECEEAARSAVRAGSGEAQKTRALVSLRAKKLAVETLSKREASKEQLECVLLSIDDAAGQKEMVKAMESSAAVLETLNKDIGGAEKVQEVMDKVAAGMADVDEVNRVLSEPDMAGAVDEDEVDEELEKMLKEMQPAAEKQDGDKTTEGQLPSVPSAEPQGSTKVEQRAAQLSQDMGKLAL